MPDSQLVNGDVDLGHLLGALRSVKRGDFTVRLPFDQTGIAGEIAEAFNDVAELLDRSTDELERISRVVPSRHSSMYRKERVCLPSPHISISGLPESLASFNGVKIGMDLACLSAFEDLIATETLPDLGPGPRTGARGTPLGERGPGRTCQMRPTRPHSHRPSALVPVGAIARTTRGCFVPA